MPALPVFCSPHPASGKAGPRMSFLTGQPGRGGRGWACLLLRASPTPAWASPRILDKSQRKPYVSPQECWGFFPLGFRSSSFQRASRHLGSFQRDTEEGLLGHPQVGGSSPGEGLERPSWEQTPPPPDTAPAHISPVFLSLSSGTGWQAGAPLLPRFSSYWSPSASPPDSLCPVPRLG